MIELTPEQALTVVRALQDAANLAGHEVQQRGEADAEYEIKAGVVLESVEGALALIEAAIFRLIKTKALREAGLSGGKLINAPPSDDPPEPGVYPND